MEDTLKITVETKYERFTFEILNVDPTIDQMRHILRTILYSQTWQPAQINEIVPEWVDGE